MRLDKFLALYGGVTRGEARGLLRAGRVCVNGETVQDAALALREDAARVTLDGEVIQYRDGLHLVLNKPAGVLTAARDPRRATVMDLLPPLAEALDCMPVGRLDLDTEGLLIFTTDGQLAHRLLSPKRHVDKLYLAETDAPLTEQDVAAFAEGIVLSDFTALPAVLEPLAGTCQARVTVQEGKFHQVKRMFQARGKTVLRLKRLAFGGVWLDESLAPGQWRELTAAELSQLMDVSGGGAHG